jgi:lipopolysaccharide/colanic/teichoic acid biosynthesis glycosyltransferase
MLAEELGAGACLTDLASAIEAFKMADHSAQSEIDVLFLDLGAWTTGHISQLKELRKLDKAGKMLVIANAREIDLESKKQMQNTGFLDELVDFRSETALLGDKIAFLRQFRAKTAGGYRPSVGLREVQMLRGAYFIKRFIDLTIASILIMLLSPLLAFIALAVGMESKGPVFSGVYRAGRGYRVFKLWSFRTMRVGADRMLQSIAHLNTFNNFGHSPHCFPGGRDPRLTRVGGFLLQSGLSKLPSLWNVILGDMSLVGNRPLPLYEASAMTTDAWVERFMAPTGLTGLWALAGVEQGGHAAAEKLRADLSYARTAGFVLDVKIIVMTICSNLRYWAKNLMEEPVRKAKAAKATTAPLSLAGES